MKHQTACKVLAGVTLAVAAAVCGAQSNGANSASPGSMAPNAGTLSATQAAGTTRGSGASTPCVNTARSANSTSTMGASAAPTIRIPLDSPSTTAGIAQTGPGGVTGGALGPAAGPGASASTVPGPIAGNTAC